MLHKSCEGITGASQAWLDYYYTAAMENGSDLVGVYYQEGTGDYWGYNFNLESDGDKYNKYFLRSVTVTELAK